MNEKETLGGRTRGGELTSYYKRKAGAQNFHGTKYDLS